MLPERFHRATSDWFASTFAAPTGCQLAAWREIGGGRDTLVAAPTGSGKTLAAFLHAIDRLAWELERGPLADETRIVYVSPLKALGNDIRANLEAPLEGIRRRLAPGPEGAPSIRAEVRTGDTSPARRRAMTRTPPHVLVTTPESLFILLTSEGGRTLLAPARTVIVDEIHAVAASKRGAHLALSLERLDALAGRRLQRIGLSATQRPIETLARFLCGGAGEGTCAIVDAGHHRPRDLDLLLPSSPLEAVMSGEVWEEVYDRLGELARAHRTTLVFVNTRRLAERVAAKVSERLGAQAVAAHHGSLARDARQSAEQRLREGALRLLVATASLELGIDIGDVDLVVQLGSPRAIATFLQRVGRSGHGVDRRPKGRLMPLSRDDLAECAALLGEVRAGRLDALRVPPAPLDVLAQHIVSAVACEEWEEEALLALVRGAHPFRELAERDFTALLTMLSEGFTTRRGRRAAYLHRDGVHRRLRAKRGARLTALTASGAIPESADYAVLLEPAGINIGTLDEDFAIESLPGDVFQLGNSSWRIARVEPGRVRVHDAAGQPPTIPFWLGEAPARTDELSEAVSSLRRRAAVVLREALEQDPELEGQALSERVSRHLEEELGLARDAASQLADYLTAAYRTLGTLPTRHEPVVERFFDESGGMQLVIHAPYGSRINRAWGLALRKRFCRRFNFELQAAATDDTIVLSLGETHSFPLEDVARLLGPHTVGAVLEQAVLDAPLFTVRWRWNANVALAVPRAAGGRRVPPALQRMQAEDLLAVVFPDQLACAENLEGERTIPDHPLVGQTLHDALHGAMDLEGMTEVVRGIAEGAIRMHTVDATEPSPLAAEVLSARPYAYLDDAPLEERRTRAVMSRRWLDPGEAGDLARLDPAALERVRAEAWPSLGSDDEIHDALMTLGCMSDDELRGCDLAPLAAAGRATRLDVRGRGIWVAAERLGELRSIHPDASLAPALEPPPGYPRDLDPLAAATGILRSRLGGLGPATAPSLAAPLALVPARIEPALAALEAQGFALRGRFSDAGVTEWCERRLLARIHRYTVARLRKAIEAVSALDFMRFLLRWQGVETEHRRAGPEGLREVLAQLESFEAPGCAWEADLLAVRCAHYAPEWLDALCLSGHIAWLRRGPSRHPGERGRHSPVSLVARRHLALWRMDPERSRESLAGCSPLARRVLPVLRDGGALFFEDLVERAGLLRFQAEDALRELVSAGQVTADGFAGFRALFLARGRERRRRIHHKPPLGPPRGPAEGGRWYALDERAPAPHELAEAAARALLERYGVVFKRLTVRETALAPWRELLAVYRRLEARGEIRGGRFVSGFAGEQFALPRAVTLLRRVRDEPPTGEICEVSAVDPLNLAGIVLPGERVPALPGNRIRFRDGTVAGVTLGRRPPRRRPGMDEAPSRLTG